MESRLKDGGRFLLSIGVAASDLTEEKGRNSSYYDYVSFDYLDWEIAHFSHLMCRSVPNKTVEVEERPSLAHPYGDQPTGKGESTSLTSQS
jgi:hypothetical protein